MFDARYLEQVRLLLQCIPAVAAQDCFALKGGSAINLFMRDMPRVSVDIDLTFLPLKARDASLARIEASLKSIKGTLEVDLADTVVNETKVQGRVAKLTVLSPSAQVKIEPNLILRGTTAPPTRRDLCAAAQERFDVFCTTLAAPDHDVYAGKLCAALDRQHPRDLFDIKALLDHGGVTPEIRRAFVVYLAGHNRPMHELLAPRIKDISGSYVTELVGMAASPPPLEALVAVQRELAPSLVASLTPDQRQFLLSMAVGEPRWQVLGIDGLERFPALQWKLLNIRRMDARKRDQQSKMLEELLRQ